MFKNDATFYMQELYYNASYTTMLYFFSVKDAQKHAIGLGVFELLNMAVNLILKNKYCEWKRH